MSEALDKVIRIVEDEGEAEDFERLKTGVVQGAHNSGYVTTAELEAPGHMVCVLFDESQMREALHTKPPTICISRGNDQTVAQCFSLAYFCGCPTVTTSMKNLEDKSRTNNEVKRNVFKELERLYLPHLLQKQPHDHEICQSAEYARRHRYIDNRAVGVISFGQFRESGVRQPSCWYAMSRANCAHIVSLRYTLITFPCNYVQQKMQGSGWRWQR